MRPVPGEDLLWTRHRCTESAPTCALPAFTSRWVILSFHFHQQPDHVTVLFTLVRRPRRRTPQISCCRSGTDSPAAAPPGPAPRWLAPRPRPCSRGLSAGPSCRAGAPRWQLWREDGPPHGPACLHPDASCPPSLLHPDPPCVWAEALPHTLCFWLLFMCLSLIPPWALRECKSSPVDRNTPGDLSP